MSFVTREPLGQAPPQGASRLMGGEHLRLDGSELEAGAKPAAGVAAAGLWLVRPGWLDHEQPETEQQQPEAQGQ